jgi:hypothetical protein
VTVFLPVFSEREMVGANHLQEPVHAPNASLQSDNSKYHFTKFKHLKILIKYTFHLNIKLMNLNQSIFKTPPS